MKTYALEQFKAGLKQNEQASKLLTAAGIDPLKDIDSIQVTNSGMAPDNKTLMVTHGKFDLDKFQTAAEGFADKNPKELKIGKEGSLHVYEMIDGKTSTFAAFADAKTMVVANSKELLLASLKKSAAGKLNKDMQTALEKIKGNKDSMWWAVVITDDMKKGLAGNDQTKDIAPKLESVTGTLDVNNEVKLAVLINTTDADAAAKIAKEINKVKALLPIFAPTPEVKPFLDLLATNLQADSEKTAATINLKLTEDMIKKAILEGKKPSSTPPQKKIEPR